MKRSVYLGQGHGDLWIAVRGFQVPAGAEVLDRGAARFWLRALLQAHPSPSALHTMAEVVESSGYVFHGAAPMGSAEEVLDSVRDALGDGSLVAFRWQAKEGGGKGPAPAAPPARAAPAQKPTVNPVIEPASLVLVVQKKAKSPAGKVEEYTHPKRQAITLKTDAAFDGDGLFKCDKPALVTFWTEKKGGTEIKINGADNAFKHGSPPKWAKGASLSHGVTLYAQAVTASAKADDIKLTLALSGGSKTNGPDDTMAITNVEVTLDICKSRPSAGAAPPPLSQDDKVYAGRTLLVQDTGGHLERAQLIVQVKPTDYKGALVLSAHKKGHVTAYPNEKPTKGEAEALPYTIADASKIPAGGDKKLWAEAKTPSDDMHDTGFVLAVKGVEDDADHVAATAVKLQLDICHRRAKKGADPVPLSDADKLKVGRFVHAQDADKSHERALLILREVKPKKFKGKVTLRASGNLELFEDEHPKAGEAALAVPHDFEYDPADPKKKNAEKKYWVQGKAGTVSGSLLDAPIDVHLTDDEPRNAEVVLLTIVKLELTAKVPTTQAIRAANAVATPAKSTDFKTSSNSVDLAKNAPATLLRNTDDIALEVKATPATVTDIRWSVEDNPGPAAKRPVPAPLAGMKSTLKTDANGGYSIVAAAGGDAPVRWNVVLVNVVYKASDSKIRLNGGKVADGSARDAVSVTSGVFDITDPANCGMYFKVDFELDAGGDATLDTYLDKVTVGIAQSMTNDTAKATYADAKTERERVPTAAVVTVRTMAGRVVKDPATVVADLAPLVLDTGNKPPAVGGDTIFLTSTTSTPAIGKKRKVETCDSPVVSFDALHPISGSAVNAVSGVNAFRVFLVAYSDDANYTYVAFGSGDWSCDYSGTVVTPAGAHPTPAWTKVAATGITGSTKLSVIKDGKPADKAGAEVRPPVYLSYILDAR